MLEHDTRESTTRRTDGNRERSAQLAGLFAFIRRARPLEILHEFFCLDWRRATSDGRQTREPKRQRTLRAIQWSFEQEAACARVKCQRNCWAWTRTRREHRVFTCRLECALIRVACCIQRSPKSQAASVSMWAKLRLASRAPPAIGRRPETGQTDGWNHDNDEAICLFLALVVVAGET